jgi:hypothetical protein
MLFSLPDAKSGGETQTLNLPILRQVFYQCYSSWPVKHCFSWSERVQIKKSMKEFNETFSIGLAPKNSLWP